MTTQPTQNKQQNKQHKLPQADEFAEMGIGTLWTCLPCYDDNFSVTYNNSFTRFPMLHSTFMQILGLC